jgi:hypothetical protein
LRADVSVCLANSISLENLLRNYSRAVCITLSRPSAFRVAQDVPIPSALDEEILSSADTLSFLNSPVSTSFV